MKNRIFLFCIITFTIFKLNASNLKNEALMIPKLDTIIGYFSFDDLETSAFDSWYLSEYDSYTIDTASLDQINLESFHQVEITVIIGTWCDDSQRETPRFVKILNYLDYDLDQVIAVGVNKQKKAENTIVDEINIKYVPTIIFYYKGNEIGRIIETPEISLEKDILKIVSNF